MAEAVVDLLNTTQPITEAQAVMADNHQILHPANQELVIQKVALEELMVLLAS